MGFVVADFTSSFIYIYKFFWSGLGTAYIPLYVDVSSNSVTKLRKVAPPAGIGNYDNIARITLPERGREKSATNCKHIIYTYHVAIVCTELDVQYTHMCCPVMEMMQLYGRRQSQQLLQLEAVG